MAHVIAEQHRRGGSGDPLRLLCATWSGTSAAAPAAADPRDVHATRRQRALRNPAHPGPDGARRAQGARRDGLRRGRGRAELAAAVRDAAAGWTRDGVIAAAPGDGSGRPTARRYGYG